MRIPVLIDGTAVRGSGIVGSLHFDLPGIFWATTLPDVTDLRSVDRTCLRSARESVVFQRNLILSRGGAEETLRLETAPAALSMEEGSATEAGDGIWSLAWPVTDEARELLKRARPDLVVWTNASSTYSSAERFVRALIDVRRAAGPSSILWAPHIAVPSNLALLHHMGVDVVDTTAGLERAGRDEWLFPDIDIGKADMPLHRPCGCPVCVRTGDSCADAGEAEGQGSSLEDRVTHAEWQYAEEERRIGFYLAMGRLRELVEARTVSQPSLGEILRLFDTDGFPYAEAHRRVTSKGTHPYGIVESSMRPEMEAYRRRFVEAYTPPPSKKVLVLVPCSYTKPYSNSPTHRGFMRALSSARSPGAFHMVSVTSPMGIVPRELEWYYPARNYDIPVTGHWTAEERSWVVEAVEHILKGGGYERVLVHLSQREYGWMGELLPPSDTTVWTAGLESSSAKGALSRLQEAAEALEAWPTPQTEIHMDDARSSLGFQVSKAVADRLTSDGAKLLGPPWFVRLTARDGQVLATWKEDRGTWHLTLQGAVRVLEISQDYQVQVNPEVKLTGDLFAPGALSAGARVRVGSETILVAGGQVVGVGEAVVPGEWFGRYRKGLVVKVRKHGRNT